MKIRRARSRGRRVPQARHRGDVPDPAAVSRANRSCASPSAAAGSAASISAWRSTPPRSAAICVSGCWRNSAASGREPTASSRSRPRSRPGSRSSSKPRGYRAELALEVAECARLIKGYGDTHKRGSANYRADRNARHSSGACRTHSPALGHRRHRQRAHRRARRPRGRRAYALPCRNRALLKNRRVFAGGETPPVGPGPGQATNNRCQPTPFTGHGHSP